MGRNWAELLEDVLVLIVGRVDLLEDVFAIAGVCRKWRSIAVQVLKKNDFNESRQQQQVPWLMLGEGDQVQKSSEEGAALKNKKKSAKAGALKKEKKSAKAEKDGRRFLSLSKGAMIRRVPLPEANGKLCFESLGWLVTISEGGEVNLLHPFSRTQIALPHLHTCKFFENQIPPLHHMKSAVLSSSPSLSNDFTLMVIHGRICLLGFWRPGDQKWTTIEENYEGPYRALTYCKRNGNFYAVDRDGTIFSCDVSVGSKPTAKVCLRGGIPDPDPNRVLRSMHRLYMAEFEGALLVVVRDDGDPKSTDYGINKGFSMFRANFSSGGNGNGGGGMFVEEVKSLGDSALFLGYGSPVFIVKGAGTKFPGVKPNCVYYTDDQPSDGGLKGGIYNLEDGSTTPPCYEVCRRWPPIWVTPSVLYDYRGICGMSSKSTAAASKASKSKGKERKPDSDDWSDLFGPEFLSLVADFHKLADIERFN